MNLLDSLIEKTVQIAIKEGVLKSKTIMIDATHTKSRYNQQSARDVLLQRAKLLRKEIYGIDESYKDKFPKKATGGLLEDVIEYCQKLSSVANASPQLMPYAKIQDRLNYLNEAIKDDIEELKLSKDDDAKRGHTTADTSFFGYKSHIAMSDERIITSAIVTTREKSDGKYLESLVEKSEKAGMEVKEILADAAYSGKDNIEFSKENCIKLLSKLNPTVSKGTRKKEGEFEFIKMLVCLYVQQTILLSKKQRQAKK